MTARESSSQAIVALALRVRDLQERAAQHYRSEVDEILRTGSRSPARIERTLDGLLDFCGHDAVFAMYRQLCHHYWSIDPAATAAYVRDYRDLWESDEDGGDE